LNIQGLDILDKQSFGHFFQIFVHSSEFQFFFTQDTIVLWILSKTNFSGSLQTCIWWDSYQKHNLLVLSWRCYTQLHTFSQKHQKLSSNLSHVVLSYNTSVNMTQAE